MFRSNNPNRHTNIPALGDEYPDEEKHQQAEGS
jgi:hypothetical protein